MYRLVPSLGIKVQSVVRITWGDRGRRMSGFRVVVVVNDDGAACRREEKKKKKRKKEK